MTLCRWPPDIVWGVPAEDRLGVGKAGFSEHLNCPLFRLFRRKLFMDADGFHHLLADPDDGV